MYGLFAIPMSFHCILIANEGKLIVHVVIAMQYGLVHIAAGDLLREEIAAGTEKGKRAKEYMDKGLLVPSEIVVMVCEW